MKSQYIKKQNIITGFTLQLVVVLFIFSGCRKFIEVDAPSTSLNFGNVFTSDATAAAVLNDIYADFSAQNNPLGNSPLQSQDVTSLSLYASLAADELELFNLNNTRLLEFYRNDLNRDSYPNYWNAIYPQVFKINNAIEGLNASNALTVGVKQQLLGEAKFLRAFCYFYLVNMYGDVPLALSSDWKINSLLARSSKSDVYQQIILDLKNAQVLLSSKFLKGDALTPYATGAEERVRPTKWAATTLLARTYLFNKEWSNAEAEATAVINNSTLFTLESLNNAFKKNNKEALWQLQPVYNNNNANTGEGRLFILPGSGPNAGNYPVYLSSNVVNTFEAGDQRKVNWVDSVKPASIAYYFPKKYKIGDVITTTQEYSTIFRLAEVYLIRAEARAMQNKVAEGQSDLNIIRMRASLGQVNVNDKDVLLNTILRERQVELFTEWGHRWFDLKRTNNIDAIMNVAAPMKGGSWNAYKAFFPLPQNDISRNPNLIQNQGY